MKPRNGEGTWCFFQDFVDSRFKGRGARNPVGLPSADRERAMAVTVVGNFKQRILGQLPEDFPVGIDPETRDKNRGGNFALTQKFDQFPVVGTRAGVQRQGNYFFVGLNPGDNPLEVFTPVFRFHPPKLLNDRGGPVIRFIFFRFRVFIPTPGQKNKTASENTHESFR